MAKVPLRIHASAFSDLGLQGPIGVAMPWFVVVGAEV